MVCRADGSRDCNGHRRIGPGSIRELTCAPFPCTSKCGSDSVINESGRRIAMT